MDLSGVIFVVLALAWAGYLIPKALKHHDEVARTRSIDRFSTAMRVLARREPVGRDARLVVAPARGADNPRVVAPTRPVDLRVRRAAARRAARAAARRRRRLLSMLVLATAVVTGLAAFAVVPWWAVAIPGGLTVLYLLLCRVQVRRERGRAWDVDLAESVARLEPASRGRRRAARVEAPFGSPLPEAAQVRRTAVNEQGFVEVAAEEDTVALDVAVLDAVVVHTADGGSLWDPLPVTLPTYVGKPKATRTVRTIDLEEPGTWTSGRTAADSALVADTAVTAVTDEHDEPAEPRRAVGS